MKTGALLSGTDPRAIKVIVTTSIGDRFTIGIKKEKIDVRLAIFRNMFALKFYLI